ncbi:2Fe-2S iron-sulfur cluster-binding protein [Leptolyngbya sp. AN02str]|uniref:2Fe-2S iron-sulfur cluster-binding protein n=1 Tax=Leptolyngbya sp. AN02str TaxID=3423363 RepID=UPI003D31D25F
MPIVQAQGRAIACETGANLRHVLLQQGIELHNQHSTIINCRGLGTCGTCAVEIEGEVSPQNWREQTRLALPPHSAAQSRRLACQTQVLGNVRVTKYNGFWGQGSQPVWTAEKSGDS